MPQTTAELLRQLEMRGVTFSRNRHFDLFAQDEPRRALKLRRLLETLRALILRSTTDPSVSIDARPTSGNKGVELRVTLSATRGRIAVRLTPQELELLATDPRVEKVLAGLAWQEEQPVRWRRARQKSLSPRGVLR